MLMDDADILSIPKLQRSFEEEKKKFILQVRVLDIRSGKPIVVLNEGDAKENDIFEGSRVLLKHVNNEKVVIVDLSSSLVPKGEIAVFKDVAEEMELENGDIVEIKPVPIPESVKTITKKINGIEMQRDEIFRVVEDVLEGKLSEAEISAWITAMHIRGLNDDEIVHLTDAMVETGDKLELQRGPIVDKHCIGGVAGNRTTMVLVPIIASIGLYIPKTSSRAITSPAGTADTMEVLAEVEFSMEELKEIVLKTRGAIVWGGGMNIAPVDDYMIKIRRPLHLDPEGVLLASILAKKKAVGSQHVIVDIPIGPGAKIEDIDSAKKLGNHFKYIGGKLGMNVGVVITDGSEPVGNGIGPALEARDVLRVLEGKGPSDLREKSLLLAGKLLELSGKVAEGDGYSVAKHFLDTGKALMKMREIIEAQGGDPKITSEEVPIGEYKVEIKAEREGKISHIDNKRISMIARAAGAPFDKGAGVYLHVMKGDKVKKGQLLMEIFADSEARLDFALRELERNPPISLEKILITELI